MKDKYNLELTKEEKIILDNAIWLYYHKAIEDLQDKKLLEESEDFVEDMIKKDVTICESLLEKIKELK
jgi:hypothetical protein